MAHSLGYVLKFTPFDSTIKIKWNLTKVKVKYLDLSCQLRGKQLIFLTNLKSLCFNDIKFQIGQKHQNIRETSLRLTFFKIVMYANGREILGLDNGPQGAFSL